VHPVANAIARARSGLDWSYPCLIWVADFVREATGTDYASDWRGVKWTEATAKHALTRLAAGGEGETAVEKAVDNLARAVGWEAADGPRQGAVMIGVYRAEDGIGVPAIFDGESRWIVSNTGKGWRTLSAAPERMWEIPHAAA